MRAIIIQIENHMLRMLLIRFTTRHIENTTWKSSELVDAATVLINEVSA